MSCSLGQHQIKGQTVVETILLLPLFLIFTFGLIQACELAVTLITLNYAAGSIARKAVQRDAAQSDEDKTHLTHLLFGRMHDPSVIVESASNGGSSVTNDLQVNACAQVNALPMLGPFVNKALGNSASDTSCSDASKIVSFGSAGRGLYVFTVKGTARARMNYTPQS